MVLIAMQSYLLEYGFDSNVMLSFINMILIAMYCYFWKYGFDDNVILFLEIWF